MVYPPDQTTKTTSLANPPNYDAPKRPPFLRPLYMKSFLDANILSITTTQPATIPILQTPSVQIKHHKPVLKDSIPPM